MPPGRKRNAPWETSAKWARVDIGDDFMLGSTEGGFMGLEVLGAEEAKLFGHHTPKVHDDDPPSEADIAVEDGQEPEKHTKPNKRERAEQKRKNKRQKTSEETSQDADEAAADSSTLAALTAKIAALEAENSALKGQASAVQPKPQPKAKSTPAKAAKAAEGSAQDAPTPVIQAQASPKQTDIAAWAPFELHSKVESAIAQMGFSQPTPIQRECLPSAIRDRRDIIGAAQTGSGKTLAFGLPILQRLTAQKEVASAQGPAKLRALILTPTRELALQVCEHLQRVGKVCGVWVVPIVGGISPAKQERFLKKLPEVVVATPGRLWELMQAGHAHLTDMSDLSFFVLDEADRMVQQGHFQEMEHILEHIQSSRLDANTETDDFDQQEIQQPRSGAGPDVNVSDCDESDEVSQEQQPVWGKKKKRMQTMVFSATLTLPLHLRKRLHKSGGGSSGSATLDRLMDKIPFGPKPKIVDLTSDRKLADKVEEAFVTCGNAERDEYLYYLLAQHPGRTLVFVNAISAVRRVAALLKLLSLPAQALHASMQQRQRLKALDRFKTDPAGVLVATDVAARGLDIPEVQCVVHYQLPASADVYVHRSGRTARGAGEGVAIALVTPQEAGRFQGLQKALARPLPADFPVDASLMPAVHKRVRLAVRLDEVQRVESKEKAESTWRQRTAAQAEIEVSDEEDESDGDEGNRAGKRKKGGKSGGGADASALQLQQELAACLRDPLVPKFSHRFFTGGGATAGVTAQQAPSAPATAKGGSMVEVGDGDAMQAPTVSRAVSLANKMQNSRKGQQPGKQQPAEEHAGMQREPEGKKRAKPVWQSGTSAAAARQQAEDRALQAAVRKSQTKKEARQRGGKLTVIPAAFGREKQGPNALQALRAKMTAVQQQQQAAAL